MILLCKAVSSCWTVSQEEVLLQFLVSTSQSKNPAGDPLMQILFKKRYYKMASLGTATYKEEVGVLLIVIICCTCWKLISIFENNANTTDSEIRIC